MFAVIKTGGKQYKVSQGKVLLIEKLEGNEGDKISFSDVLAVGEEGKMTFGAPMVKGAVVSGQIVRQTRADKVLIFKKRRRKNYRRLNGHRQHLTLVRIEEVKAS